jgi:hypothetical protein
MSKRSFLGFLLWLIVIVDLSAFDYSDKFILKKDEVAKIEIIKKDYKTHRVSELKFRWTLYHNDRLVLLVNYDGFATQYILKKEYQRDSIKIDLVGDYVNIADKVYLILKFRDFKNDKKLADFDVMIKDLKKRVEVKFIHPKR